MRGDRERDQRARGGDVGVVGLGIERQDFGSEAASSARRISGFSFTCERRHPRIDPHSEVQLLTSYFEIDSSESLALFDVLELLSYS